MAIDLILSPDPYSRDPLEKARRTLLKTLAHMKVPYIPTYPDPDSLGELATMAREVVAMSTTLMRAVGDEIERQADLLRHKYALNGGEDSNEVVQ